MERIGGLGLEIGPAKPPDGRDRATDNGWCGARDVSRTHVSGAPWVTVRPYYEGPPFSGLDVAGRAGRNSRARGSEKACPSRGSYGPEVKNRRQWSAERRAPFAKGAAAPQGAAVSAPLGAPLPSFREPSE